MNRDAASAVLPEPPHALEASRFGMWIFIVSEALLFGSMFLSFLISRLHHHEAFASGSHALSFWLGTINTAVLLTSSLTIKFAELSMEQSSGRRARLFLLLTIALGALFVTIKLTEYREEYLKGLVPFVTQPFRYEGPDGAGAQLFFDFYFALTALHALHLSVGGLIIAAICWTWPRTPDAPRLRRVNAMALYWHFVDVVWVFLYPVLYLIK